MRVNERTRANTVIKTQTTGIVGTCKQEGPNTIDHYNQEWVQHKLGGWYIPEFLN